MRGVAGWRRSDRTETAEGGLRVDVLKDGAWTPGRIGMVGLRLATSTRKLSPDAVLKLPA